MFCFTMYACMHMSYPYVCVLSYVRSEAQQVVPVGVAYFPFILTWYSIASNILIYCIPGMILILYFVH